MLSVSYFLTLVVVLRGLRKFTIITFSAVQYKISIFFLLHFTIKQKRKEKRKVEQAKTKTKALSGMTSVQS